MQKTIFSLSAAVFAIFTLTAAFPSSNDSYAISMVIRDGDVILAKPKLITRAHDDNQFSLDMGNGRSLDIKAKVNKRNGKANVRWNLELVNPKHAKVRMQENMTVNFNKDVLIVGGIPRNSLSHNRDFTIIMSVDKKIIID